MNFYLSVVEQEGDEAVELPLNEDGTLSLSNLAAQFPGASGLKYRNPETGTYRGVRFQDGCFCPTDGVWPNVQYVAVFPKDNKRKGEEGLENPMAKTKKTDKCKCSDLIVLGLPWKSSEEDLRKYFSTFGELLMVQVKKDIHTGQSKGFGFIRYASYESQLKCLSQRHLIDGRWCDVRIPNSKGDPMELGMPEQMSNKVFVGRCTESISADDLRTYFSKYGEVTDIFIPKPFRAFAFVSFADGYVAKQLCDEADDHIIRGTSVYVSSAAPKGVKSGGSYSERSRMAMSPSHPGHQGNYGSGFGLPGTMMKHGAGGQMSMGPSASGNANYPYSSPVGVNFNMLNTANVAMLAAAALAQGWGQMAGVPATSGGFGAPTADGQQNTGGNSQISARGYDNVQAGGSWGGATSDGASQWRGEMKPAGWN